MLPARALMAQLTYLSSMPSYSEEGALHAQGLIGFGIGLSAVGGTAIAEVRGRSHVYRSTVLPMYGRTCSHYLAEGRGAHSDLGLIFGNQEPRMKLSNPSDAPVTVSSGH